MTKTAGTDTELAALIAQAEASRFTGTLLGPATFSRARDIQGVRQVFEYERGECTDRYVTTVRG